MAEVAIHAFVRRIQCCHYEVMLRQLSFKIE